MTFKTEIIFVRILIPLIFGIVFAYILLDKSWINCYLIASLVLLFFLLINNILYQKLKIYYLRGYVGISFYLLFFSIGGLITLLNHNKYKDNYFANHPAQLLKVKIANEPQLKGEILRFEVHVIKTYHAGQSKNVTGKLLIALKTDSLNPLVINYGDDLLLSAVVAAVEPPFNPSEFDFKNWLASKNINHQSFLNQNHVVILGTNSGNRLVKYAIEVRKKQVEIYRKIIKNNEAFAVASTLVLGYRSDLSKDTLAAYSKTGTIHALSVSGMHVGIIYIFLNWILFFLEHNKRLKILKISLIGSIIWYYALLTGFSPSVLRSAIMLSVYIFAKSFNKNSNSYNILAFTAFCLLIYEPFLIWDVGFQLSFLAVFGLIYLQPKIYKWYYFKNKWADKLWSTVALSIAAQVATFPLSIYYFHQFPLYFIFSNLFILLPLTLMMYLGIVILLLRLYFLAPIFEWIIIFTNSGLKWIAELPFSGISAIWLSNWQLFWLSCSLATLIYGLSTFKKKLILYGILTLIIFQSIGLIKRIENKKQKKIIFFSLRKNYATAFISANESVVVTDLNYTDKNYLYFVEPALHELQVTKINFIKWDQDTSTLFFEKRENQLIFNNYKILLLDSSFNNKSIINFPKFEAVWLHNNPKINLEDLKNQLKFNTLILDATNKDYKIKKYESEAKKVSLSTKILKKNKAYLIDFK